MHRYSLVNAKRGPAGTRASLSECLMGAWRMRAGTQQRAAGALLCFLLPHSGVDAAPGRHCHPLGELCPGLP